MVHTFCVDGRYLALDVDSGTVHMLDELGYEVVSRWEESAPEEIVRALAGRFPEEEIREGIGEVRALQESGTLFSHDEDLHKAPADADPGVIKAMCLLVAHDCNLRCRYCFASTGTFHGKRLLMPAEIGKKALDFLVARSGSRRHLEVDFFGGEPMLNFPVVKELVAYGRELEKKHGKVFRFTITTNAYSLTDEDIDYFNREMSNVVLSVDGRKETHDAMRPTADGQGSWERAMANAKKVAAARKQQDYYVRGTFTKKNLDFGEDVFHYYDDLGFDQISMEPVVTDPANDYALTEADIPAVNAEYERLAKKIIEYRKAGKFFNYFHFMIDLDQGPCAIKRLRGCGCGNEYVAVSADGDVYPCHQFVGKEEWKMGSVYTPETFDLEKKDYFARANVYSKEGCKDCWAKFYCSGGCNANNLEYAGDVLKPYPISCEFEKKRLECAIMIKAALAAEGLDDGSAAEDCGDCAEC